jgi:putative hydrolase of the HAD superfamily
MRRDARAVVFDLDDTLYPYRRFRVSGFLAVARYLADRADLQVSPVFRTLVRALREPRQGMELQACLSQLELPETWLPELIDVFRYHQPRLRLPATSRRVLQQLRADGWRVGVLTNGPRDIQSAKVAALGLASCVDVVGYASTIGTGRGKPEPDTFAWMARTLAVPAARTVFVGDNEQCDIEGARAAGMLAVRCAAWIPSPPATTALAVIHRLPHLPAIASSLIEEASNRHAA